MSAVALGLEARLVRHGVVEALGDDAEIGGRQRRIEADEELARLDLVAVLDVDLGDRAAGLVLDLLDVELSTTRRPPVTTAPAKSMVAAMPPSPKTRSGRENADHDVPADAALHAST